MTEPVVYSWGYLAEVVGWSRYAAAAAAVVGMSLTHDYRVPLSIVIGAAVDVLTMNAIARKAQRMVDSTEAGVPRVGLADIMAHMTVRIGSKALLLAAAALLPAVLDFWGMVVGVLIVDATLLVVGTAVAAVRTFGSGSGSA